MSELFSVRICLILEDQCFSVDAVQSVDVKIAENIVFRGSYAILEVLGCLDYACLCLSCLLLIVFPSERSISKLLVSFEELKLMRFNIYV